MHGSNGISAVLDNYHDSSVHYIHSSMEKRVYSQSEPREAREMIRPENPRSFCLEVLGEFSQVYAVCAGGEVYVLGISITAPILFALVVPFVIGALDAIPCVQTRFV